MKVLAAMSGGVDSAVAAARAVDAGHEVVGVHLALSRMPGTLRTGSRGCCTVEDAMDARRVADRLGIPFYVWDFSERFHADVVQDFVDEYAAGRTPNPCLRCNERIKFEALLDRAIGLGFDRVVTGHYARVEHGDDGPQLHRAADWAKDQSYVLGVLTEEQLRHCWFPLADTPTKAAVRAEAAERGFLLAQKPDSHDICFIPDGDTRGFLAERLGAEPGEIVDRDGAVVGQHAGVHGYTVGQRRGLSLGVPSPDGRPRFVLEVKPSTRQLVVGPEEALAVSRLAGTRVSHAGPAHPGLAEGLDVEVQIRAHADPVPARARMVGDELVIDPAAPLRGVATGQSAVLYLGTRVLGQCTIDRTVAADAVPA
ncbi:tRNA 2-thiouridine(34) synthase MnmA [Agrococcus sediminis]|uniref:tRNA-specific 2-thiouridylase MnmA n=1 Tax=Agrococcus sediminis TaxID=2599924 RepID=A0A5M8QD44_9MICO|nr:tRNA 2-thiouridine(34) synthase MnmA [Agrococcus sediminis]KAA6433098.1 tRNA 2-thiouridine(34) synthase MnmA [Agrococcus sediminis]RWR25443.1 tRNA 2-thiouridine(34) synthase MnmA [Agrococcus lahaulensis]